MVRSGEFLSSKDAYNHYWMNVKLENHKFPDDETHDFIIVHAPDWSLTVPITENNEFIMIDQYRPAWRSMSLEFPGGRCDPNESFIDAAIRELREESGYIAQTVKELGGGKPVSWSTQEMHVFEARDLHFEGQELDAAEDIEVELVPIPDFWNRYEKGDILHWHTVMAYLLWRRSIDSNIETVM